MDDRVMNSLQDAIGQFKEGARLQYAEGQRLARRTAQIIRWSSAGMIILGIGLLALLLTLTKNLSVISERMEGMHGHTESMSRDFLSVSQKMNTIAADMKVISLNMNEIHAELSVVPKEMDRLNITVSQLNEDVLTISQEFQVMNGQLNGISQSMVRMTHDTDQMSRPMRMLPWP
ncbi:MAG: hypothetical protein LC667_15855 [Thioalkalivibrio sp.]|nr:hypothetical protein [Thioalkalivibrio sp.]